MKLLRDYEVSCRYEVPYRYEDDGIDASESFTFAPAMPRTFQDRYLPAYGRRHQDEVEMFEDEMKENSRRRDHWERSNSRMAQKGI